MIVLFYGDQIAPGSQPVLVFPVVYNQIELAADLLSTEGGSITLTEESGSYSGIDEEAGTPDGVNSLDSLTALITGSGAGLVGFQHLTPITGQVSNLAVTVSKDGAAFAAATGTLSEIANGYYKYVPATTETNNPPTANSSNTGTVAVRIAPTDPRAAATNTWIHETMVIFRLRPQGIPTVNINPGQADQLFGSSGLIQPAIDQLENFIRQAIRDLLGNQMTTKPTFRRD